MPPVPPVVLELELELDATALELDAASPLPPVPPLVPEEVDEPLELWMTVSSEQAANAAPNPRQRTGTRME